MTTKMETLDPSTLSDINSAVTYNHQSQTLTLPGGVTSVAGITVVTGGAELSCASCMLAFCFWKILIGFSCVAVGLYDQLSNSGKGTSHLLGMGFVILAFSFVVVGSIVAYDLLTKKERAMTRAHREDGKEVLVERKIIGVCLSGGGEVTCIDWRVVQDEPSRGTATVKEAAVLVESKWNIECLQ
ncbi:unnamed protein product [Pleuronectes platessa]|uniref:Transmembrane protein n=1 Tax=Pleuronectes platessa TaxID=8262 RepID=A0A9N7VI88_PLEPL|nr:unnamed protein product [Pleuronectes platessa]